MLLCKGVEVEMYTGTPTGDVVGLSDRIVRDLEGFVREPDSRNVEYTTAPLCCYDRLLCALLKPRQSLRQYLEQQGNYTIIPGSTLSLGGSERFYRSDPHNPYHSYIEETYGTKVVTASIHLNIGIPSTEILIQACRLVRVEAPLYLALSASSPFLDGQVTGYHSTRWQMFPKTPQHVPLFTSHPHFIAWTQEQLAQGKMQNVRHLWTSVRPNGDRRPYLLNRLELRICDLIIDPLQLLAVIALLEARITQLIENPQLDPLQLSSLSPEKMLELTDNNELAAAANSLDAQLSHWKDGRTIVAREWIEELYQEVFPVAKKHGFACFLSPLSKILQQGNQAQRWLKQYKQGLSIEQIMTESIETTAIQEQELESKICAKLLVA
ncbi:glutamate--cysteine ligase [Gloeocapsa sp. PCC 73106]|uniref:glutamate--cysteine ligase n=1 Tax=Gloeocapsa sp. PCC 73106 TaxID=102232 RepID=UPI0002ABF1B6|nr:glutamate--cysteine ligase [Gloeocapsa sp. PCC 73106]ELR98976.1 glutamate--cysteine ligase, cyanobacterial, putative [Gloeocapsa sp. PCC 73106]